VYRRHAISGREQTSSQFLVVSRDSVEVITIAQCITYMDPPRFARQCCLMALSTSWEIADGRLPGEAI